MTVVGTGVLNFIFGNSRVNTSRNCSSFSPTFLISFSFAFPSRKKFLVRTLTHVSLADTVACWETTTRRQRLTARGKIKRFINNPMDQRWRIQPDESRIALLPTGPRVGRPSSQVGIRSRTRRGWHFQ